MENVKLRSVIHVITPEQLAASSWEGFIAFRKEVNGAPVYVMLHESVLWKDVGVQAQPDAVRRTILSNRPEVRAEVYNGAVPQNGPKWMMD